MAENLIPDEFKGRTLNFVKINSKIKHSENAEILYNKDKIIISKSTVHKNMYQITREKGVLKSSPNDFKLKINGVEIERLTDETHHGVLVLQ